MVVICPTAQGQRVRHFGTTGNSGMAGMRALPVGQADLVDRHRNEKRETTMAHDADAHAPPRYAIRSAI
jgi:hypothetical protein